MVVADSDMLSVGDAARVLGVSTARVRQLDAVLEPTRLSNGARLYARARVEALREARAVKVPR